jgi:hypothetical protein
MRVRRRPDLAFRVIDEETWIVSPRDSRLHRLNSTASHLWALLESEPTVDALALALVKEFEVDESHARADAERFVHALVEQGVAELLEDRRDHG